MSNLTQALINGLPQNLIAVGGFVLLCMLIFGLMKGKGWLSLRIALETGLTTGVGAWLGWNTGFYVGGPVLGSVGAVIGGINGFVGGANEIYDWGSLLGWLAFLLDSTWGLLGTSLGILISLVNLLLHAAFDAATYSEAESHRKNRTVWKSGFRIQGAFTGGNVVTNIDFDSGNVDTDVLNHHETLHIWQYRCFGPLMLTSYVVWLICGAIVGVVVGLFHLDQFGSIVQTVAYYDNPWETWAYKNQEEWPGNANKVLRWP